MERFVVVVVVYLQKDVAVFTRCRAGAGTAWRRGFDRVTAAARQVVCGREYDYGSEVSFMTNDSCFRASYLPTHGAS